MEDFIKRTRSLVYGINLFAIAFVLVIAFMNKELIANGCPMRAFYTAQITSMAISALLLAAGFLISRKFYNDSKKETNTDLRFKKWRQSKLAYQIIWGLGAMGTAMYFHMTKDYYSIYVSIIFMLMQTMHVPGKEKSIEELS